MYITRISVVQIINGRLLTSGIPLKLHCCSYWPSVEMALVWEKSVALIAGDSYVATLTPWALLISSTIFASRRNCWNCNICSAAGSIALEGFHSPASDLIDTHESDQIKLTGYTSQLTNLQPHELCTCMCSMNGLPAQIKLFTKSHKTLAINMQSLVWIICVGMMGV